MNENVIQKNWQELIKPDKLQVSLGSDARRTATVSRSRSSAAWPQAGQCAAPHSAVVAAGCAVQSVHIDGVLHEFSSIAGVREDGTDIVLNIKDIAIRMHAMVRSAWW